MSIAVIGSQGQLGKELTQQLGKNALPLNHSEIEISSLDSVQDVLAKHKPEIVINAAAYNFVDLAEDEPEKAYLINGLGPRNLAIACEEFSVPLLHVSSDYVFGQAKIPDQPYIETDSPFPSSSYAISKLAGEYFVQSCCQKHFVVRTCGLYGTPSEKGKGNFVETMLRLGSERSELNVVEDQKCTPTSAKHVASVILNLIKTDAYGLYHATNSGEVTWREFACEIFSQAGMDVKVNSISTKEFGAKANRPAYSVMNCDKIVSLLDDPIPSWKDALSEYLSNR